MAPWLRLSRSHLAYWNAERVVVRDDAGVMLARGDDGIAAGQMRAIEFLADQPSDWAFRCHKSHHAKNAMGRNVPAMIGGDQSGVAEQFGMPLPDHRIVGDTGGAMSQIEMPLSENTSPVSHALYSEPIGQCSNCLMTPRVSDISEEAPKRFTDATLADIEALAQVPLQKVVAHVI